MHALIIDDNVTNTEVLMQLLAVENIPSTPVFDPRRLKATMETIDGPDIVFLDLELPYMNGYQVLDLLQDDYCIQAPIVAYTVHTSEAPQARARGFHSFLSKPVRPEQFSLHLHRILSGHSVWEI